MHRDSIQIGAEKFGIGEIVITPAASAVLEANGTSLEILLARHQSGDWGDVSEPVRTVNQLALSDCFNLQSTYTMVDGKRVVVVTNRDRSLTMVHLDVC